MAIYSVKDQDLFTDQLRHVVRLSGLLMPVAVITLGIAVMTGMVQSENYKSDQLFFAISVPFILIGLWQYFHPRVTTRSLAITLSLYHLFASIFLLFITGLPSPIIGCWLILIIAADIFFGLRGYILSVVWLYATATVDFLINPSDDVGKGIEITYYLVLMMVTGGVVSRLRGINEGEHEALHQTKKQEVLQRDRLMTLINSMSDAVINTDQDGFIKVYNAASLNLIDTNRALSGQNIDAVLNLYDENDKRVHIVTILQTQGSSVRTDLSHRFKNGEMINLYISISPIRPTYQQKTHYGFIVVLRDITKEKSLDEERDEFISVVSHELRTPIAIAEGNLSNVGFLLNRPDTKKQFLESAIKTAHEQVMYLAKMTNDLSTLSRAERGVADDPEDININELLEGLYAEYRPQAEAKKLTLDLDIHGKIGTVFTSRLYLEEILQNFITNAIKYTKEGSVTIKGRRLPGGLVELGVADTGIGISKSDQRHIFDKFYRSEDYRTRETNGTGLGLYVVHKLASKLRTKIELKSRLNNGSTFTFTLPLKGDRPKTATGPNKTKTAVTAANTLTKQ